MKIDNVQDIRQKNAVLLNNDNKYKNESIKAVMGAKSLIIMYRPINSKINNIKKRDYKIMEKFLKKIINK